ncbi:Hpt domain-containing protein [Gymnodinialimonas ceratoperidinii]|uniref:Hpt domain-containing protein n=1 Tax=Gymnodinialimonas ceratoperidinii TaxID=2856823 RepID=A0A8F6YAH3_9RHOB|nr:Hpt domain-containing protein [Gymnodinialimonas ceratoperidinii]QXT39939.1 Hpt domain-containing protein [Gymnodinialimonas ceratoperidinii]
MTHVDWDRLNDLRADIGEEDFADVALLFVAELQETLHRLTPQAATAADFHFLRGSAANLGFVALVAACTRAEDACNEGATPDIRAVADAFASALAEVTPQVPELASAA